MNGNNSPFQRQRGFTLLEAAFSVLLMGIVLASIMVARNQSAARSTAAESAFMDTAVSSLVKFAKRNGRLPCPDVDGDGAEDATDGVCTDPAVKAGGIPYLTLEMPLSAPVGTGIDRQFVYAVYRGGADAAKDLTLSAERTVPPHVAPHVSYANLDDFKQALSNAAAASLPAVDSSNLYVTGNDGDSGPSNCAGNLVANVAFAIAFSGARNADDQGTDFDGVHLVNAGWNAATKWNSVRNATCFVGPGKALIPTFDDEVKAVGFLELMGMVSR